MALVSCQNSPSTSDAGAINSPSGNNPPTPGANPADHLVLVQGNSQRVRPGELLPVSPKVRVLDMYGLPVAGTFLVFQKLSEDATLESTSIQMSDINGYASVSLRVGFQSATQKIKVYQLGENLPNILGSGSASVQFTVFAAPTLGDGTFDSEALVATAAPSQDIVTADFDGDGDLDLAFTHQTTNQIGVSLGNGLGTFDNEKLYSTGSSPWQLSVGDFNSDNIPDLVVSTLGVSSVSVLIGKGDGTFKPFVTFPTISPPKGIDVGDLNNDGHADIVICHDTTGYAGVLLGKGDGTFEAHLESIILCTRTLSLGDFNEDGYLDIATSDWTDTMVYVAMGNGDGTFGAEIPLFSPGGAQQVEIADVDNDSHLDLVISGFGSSTINVFRGNGFGGFGSAQVSSVTDANISVGLGDFNGDGKLDVVSGYYNIAKIGISLGKGDGTFELPVDYPATRNHSGWGSAIGDFNNDGIVDFALPKNYKYISIYKGR